MENTLQSLNINDIRRERNEAKKLQKEIPGWHEEEVAAPGAQKNSAAGAEEKQRLWLREVNEDPYTREAMAVLDDMAGITPAIAQPAALPEADRSIYSRPRPR
jgi:carboxyl-terminal processing protease